MGKRLLNGHGIQNKSSIIYNKQKHLSQLDIKIGTRDTYRLKVALFVLSYYGRLFGGEIVQFSGKIVHLFEGIVQLY